MYIEDDERRSARRFGVELAAALVDAGGDELDIKVINISSTGAALLAPTQLGQGENYTIKLPVQSASGESVLAVTAHVRHSIAGSTQENGSKQVVHVVGVEFEFESIEDRALHDALIVGLESGSELPQLAERQ